MPRKPAPKLRYTQEDVDAIIRAVLASSPPADMQRQIAELMEEIRVLRAERLHSHAGRPMIGPMIGPMIAEGSRDATESRALKISKTRAGAKAHPVVKAIHAAGLTPQSAAELCGTSRDVLKQAWAKGRQFRPVKAEWRKKLAEHGVPETVWPERG